MSFITFLPPGRNPLPGLVRTARQSFDWTRRLAAPINAVMALKADDEGVFLLRWQRRKERGDAP
jgi:hypothetical protein